MVRPSATRSSDLTRTRLTWAAVAVALISLPCAARQAGSTPRPALARSATPVVDKTVVDEVALDRLERTALDGVNAERAAAGLPPLECTVELCRLARLYSRDMVERHYFAHSDPEGRMVDARADGAGIHWRSVGENIARNRGFKDPAEVAVREWMKSEGHRENILDARYRETGIGVWVAPDKTVYFTQIFLTRSAK